jgi:hypothetical protein
MSLPTQRNPILVVTIQFRQRRHSSAAIFFVIPGARMLIYSPVNSAPGLGDSSISAVTERCSQLRTRAN